MEAGRVVPWGRQLFQVDIPKTSGRGAAYVSVTVDVIPNPFQGEMSPRYFTTKWVINLFESGTVLEVQYWHGLLAEWVEMVAEVVILDEWNL